LECISVPEKPFALNRVKDGGDTLNYLSTSLQDHIATALLFLLSLKFLKSQKAVCRNNHSHSSSIETAT
jgi:hypothetical protein